MTACGLSLASAQAQELDARKDDAKPPPLSLRLSYEVISKAVRETLAESKGGPKREQGKALSGDAYRKFEKGFSEAEKPGCLRPDALKFQSASTVVKTPFGAFNVGAGGIFALPFWAAAVARGKCN
jgi:hypothetical protein